MTNTSDFETLLDGKQVELHYLDGTSEFVLIRKIGIRKLSVLAQVWGNEPKEIALYAGKNEAWVETLTDESFETAIEEGRLLNTKAFAKWFRRQAQTMEALGQSPMIKELTEKILSDLKPSPSPS